MKHIFTLCTSFLLIATMVAQTSEEKTVAIINQKTPGKGQGVINKVKTIPTGGNQKPTVHKPMPEQKPMHTPTGEQPSTTVYEDLQVLTKPQLEKIIIIADGELEKPQPPVYDADYEFWKIFRRILERVEGTVKVGKTYGDPHIQTFDGYQYDLQSVGEFVLCRSTDGNFEIQTRQKMRSEKVSMNSACVIQMVGDKIGVEANPNPTKMNQIITVNGDTIQLGDGTSHSTPNGALIRRQQQTITVHSPLGERVMIKPLSNGEYMSVVPTIVEDGSVTYEGLLGNANGDPSDDLYIDENKIPAYGSFYTEEDLAAGGKISNATAKAEKTHQKTIATQFGDQWRLSDSNSLFTYAPGKSTSTYTDFRFPMEYTTISDFDKKEVKQAKKDCETAGITQTNMKGCMTDVLLMGDPKATEYSKSVQQELIVESLGLKNAIFEFENKPLTASEIKTISKQINTKTAEIKRAKRLNTIQAVTGMGSSKPQPTTSPGGRPTTTPGTSPSTMPSTSPQKNPGSSGSGKTPSKQPSITPGGGKTKGTSTTKGGR